MKVKICGHLATERRTMNPEKIKVLQKKFGVSEKDLRDIGILPKIKEPLTGKITKDEYSRVEKELIRKSTNSTITGLIRDKLIEITTYEITQPIILNIKSVKLKPKDKEMKQITIPVEEKKAEEIRKICRLNRINIDTLIRYSAIEAGKDVV